MARAGRSGFWRRSIDEFVRGLIFPNGFFLFATIFFAVVCADHFDNSTRYWWTVIVWVTAVYVNQFCLLGHLRVLEEELTASHDSLQAIRARVTTLPILGMLPFLAIDILLG